LIRCHSDEEFVFGNYDVVGLIDIENQIARRTRNAEKFEGRLLEVSLNVYWFLSVDIFISIFNFEILYLLFAHHVTLVSAANFELWKPHFAVSCAVATRFLETLQAGFYIIVHRLILNLTCLVWNQNYEINVVFNRVKYQYLFELGTCASENFCLSNSHEIKGFATNFE
jgi:hypothetical protein